MSDAIYTLEMIETVVGEDLEWWQLENLHEPFTGREAAMLEKLSHIYRLAHGFNPNHSCHHVHTEWRIEGWQALTAEYGARSHSAWGRDSVGGEEP